jgi:hypothetical protein
MKICEYHWTALRQSIETTGMSHLVAQGGSEAAARLQTELKGGEAPYDPLMSCHWMITNRAVELGGPYLLTGDYCPICEAMKNLGDKPDNAGRVWTSQEIEQAWITGPVFAALEYCQEHDLL